MPLHIYVRVFVCMCWYMCECVSVCVSVCVCVHPLISLKLPLRAFVLLRANPLVNLLSAMSQTVCSGE